MFFATPGVKATSALKQLDAELADLRRKAYAPSTYRGYHSNIKTFLAFCSTHDLQPVPASPLTICRYITFLARDKALSTIQQYLSSVRLLHLELGYNHPYQDSYSVSSLLKGVKRVKGQSSAYKLPLSIKQIHSMHTHLDIASMPGLQLWCVINLCFYGLLRIGSVTVPNKQSWDSSKILTRGDITITNDGCILKFRHTKTIQYGERVFEAAIPRLPGTPHCPTSLLMAFLLKAGSLPDSSPALAYLTPGGKEATITPAEARKGFKHLLSCIGLSTKDHNTHSLRRSGASHLLSAGVDLSVIRCLGDWKSDAIFRYLQPDCESKIKLSKQGFASTT